MKNRAVLSVTFILFAFGLFAQNSGTTESGLLSGDYGFMRPMPFFGMQMGTQYMTGMGGAGLFSQSFAPYLQFKPGQNFSVVAGSILSTSSFSGSSPFLSTSAAPDRLFSTTVYALGAYQVNPRLIVTGGAWGERNNMNQLFMGPQMNPQAFDLSAGGMMLGMDYKITENLRFGAEINLSRGQNPFNPYGNTNPFSPFNSSYRRHPW